MSGATLGAELALGSDDPDPDHFALAFRVLQSRFLRLLLRPEGLGQQCELPADVFVQKPPLDDSGHGEFIARAALICGL